MEGSPGAGKRALLMGIDQYPLFPPQAQLHGCVTDIAAMAGLLEQKFGFDPAHITQLQDNAATQAGIRAAFEALIAAVGPNDLVVIHYSGHGSEMTDREGDEPDGRDSTIVPSDSGRDPQPNRDITDDEIYLWVSRLTEQTPFVTWIFDSCHSGTILRDNFGMRARRVAPDLRPATQLPPPVPGITAARQANAARAGASGWLPIDGKYVLLSGCRDDESSYEYPCAGSQHGALTYFLVQALQQAAPGATYRDVFEQVSAQVLGANSSQHPQLEGAADRELFGTHDFPPMRFVPVTARAGNTVTLGAGAAHGLTAGSQWAVYPAGTKQVTAGSPPLGTATLTAIGPVTAQARIDQEAPPGALAPQSRAVEQVHALAEMRLRVIVQAPPVETQALTALVTASPLLLPGGDGPPDICVYLLPARGQASPGDPVPQVPRVAEPTWAIVGADGQVAGPLQPASDPAAIKNVVTTLESLVRYRAALAIRNPDPASALKGQVVLQLLRPDAGGNWQVATPDPGGQVIFRVGDDIGFELVNNAGLPVYPVVLDFGLTGKIDQFYPPRDAAGAAEGLRPGGTYQLITSIGFPDGFPYVPPSPGTAAGGTEVLKLFVTTTPADFTPLLQPGARDQPSTNAHPLTRLLYLAATGAGTRNMVFENDERDLYSDWTTSEVSFRLEQAG